MLDKNISAVSVLQYKDPCFARLWRSFSSHSPGTVSTGVRALAVAGGSAGSLAQTPVAKFREK